MATVYQQFGPGDALFPTSNPAAPTLVQGTNFPVDGLAFDGGSTDELCYFKFRAINYGSGNVTVDVYWYADTASSGNVVFGAQLSAITPNTDSQDIETDGLDTAATVQDAHLGTTGQRLHHCAITVTAVDSLANGDYVTLRFYRDASDTSNDTMTGDAIVVLIVVSYSDT